MDTPISRESQPKKIAILGGGMAALTTAFELTDQPNWQEKYEITVYQLGWRLGGKCASGRNLKPLPQHPPAYRIEEHGIHLWFGFYENSFRLLQQCYEELARSPEAPLSIWQEAFKPQGFFVIEEFIKDNWLPWTFNFPMNDEVPGQGADDFLDIWAYVRQAIEFIHDRFMDSPHSKLSTTASRSPRLNLQDFFEQMQTGWENSFLGFFQKLLEDIKTDLEASTLNRGGLLLYTSHKLAQSSPHPSLPEAAHRSIIGWLLKRFIEWFWAEIEPEIDENTELRRLFIVLDLAIANIVGVIEDDIIGKGFDAIDHLDYREWISQHGANNDITLSSAAIRGIYDLGFAYVDGDTNQPSYAAGATLRGLMLSFFAYKGAFLWKMQAGMGEAVIAPFYQLLTQRGVKFQFFQRVANLGLSADQKSIATLTISQQINLKTEVYNPLISVKNLPCWPSEPLYEQIENGDELRNYNLESFYTPWQDVGEKVLKQGEDFDLVVLGISLASLPFICPELIAVSQKWRDMVQHLKTVQTQSLQMWQKPDDAGLGWQFWKEPSPLLASYVEPYDNWIDMSHLIIRECWPPEHYPNSIAYFCSVLQGAPEPPPASNYAFPQQAADLGKQNAIDLLNNKMQVLWPRAFNAKGFNWDLLVDPNNGSGAERLNSQYLRVNIDPSERYVQSVPGSTQYRLQTDKSGFNNLYLTGDWIYNGFNSGAVESAVISGMQTSRAISGYPKHIAGENF